MEGEGRLRGKNREKTGNVVCGGGLFSSVEVRVGWLGCLPCVCRVSYMNDGWWLPGLIIMKDGGWLFGMVRLIRNIYDGR